MSTQELRRDGRITAVVYSYNEADLLESCLPHLADFEEVLVCDMQSSDGTRAVAERHGARVIEVPFAPIVEMVRQVGVDAVTTEWVLFVDADEHLPAGFHAAMLEEIRTVPDLVAMRLRYDNYAFGTRLTHALRGSAKFALMRSDSTRYAADPTVHVPPSFDGRTVDATDRVSAVAHYNFRTVDQSSEKVLRYARSHPQNGERLADPLYLVREIVRDVVFGGGWRDGRAGVVLQTINAFGRFYAAALDWEAAGYPDPGWPRRTTRLLDAAARAQRPVVRLRDRLTRRR